MRDREHWHWETGRRRRRLFVSGALKKLAHKIMPSSNGVICRQLTDELAAKGYVFCRGCSLLLSGEMRRAFMQLKVSYSNLPLDHFLADDGEYRFRRYSAFRVDSATSSIRVLPMQPYRQAEDVNRFAGGIDRYFEPLSEEIRSNALITRLISEGIRCFEELERCGPGFWHVDVHAVRIVARHEQPGKPSPEGIHRDGFDYISVHLIGRDNILGGVSRIYNERCRPIAHRSFRRALDCLYMDDKRFFHDVTPLKTLSAQGYRDVLLMSYKRIGSRSQS